MPVTLDSKLAPVVGDKSAKPLTKAFGIETVGDLLRHYPRRYLEIGQLTPLGDLELDQHVTIMAEVRSIKKFSFGPNGRRTRTEVLVTDQSGEITLTFFAKIYALKPGDVGLFSGVVGSFRGQLQLTHPQHDPVGDRLARGVVPIYPASAAATSITIEKCVGLCLDAVENLPELLPEEVRVARGYADVAASFESVHRPHSVAEAMAARARFRFEEAFVIQTVLAQRRYAAAAATATARPARPGVCTTDSWTSSRSP